MIRHHRHPSTAIVIVHYLFLVIVEYCKLEGCTTLPDFSIPRPLEKLQRRPAAMELLLVSPECQDQRFRSEAVMKKADRRRPASLDFHNVVLASSSRLAPAVKRPRSHRHASLGHG
ncbi:unnamed protein product [Linum trigynum]|uniref:Secreted protein n=1 Tax=Linum trigynum TaxID=586398 RepID=A0AAV2DVZ2_9ROSI